MLYFKYVKQHLDYVLFSENIKEKMSWKIIFLVFGCSIENIKEN